MFNLLSHTEKIKDDIGHKNLKLKNLKKDEISVFQELEIYKELEEYNKNILKNKCLVVENQLEQQNEILYNNIESKKNFLKNDLLKARQLVDVKNKDRNSLLTEEIFGIINKFKNNIKKSQNLIKMKNEELRKIQEYQKNHSMTNLELIKFLDQNSYVEGKININIMKNNLIRLRILNSEECTKFVEFIRMYFEDDNIKNEVMISILELNDDTKDIKTDEEEDEEEVMIQLLKDYNDIKELADSNQSEYLVKNKKGYLKVSFKKYKFYIFRKKFFQQET